MKNKKEIESQIEGQMTIFDFLSAIEDEEPQETKPIVWPGFVTITSAYADDDKNEEPEEPHVLVQDKPKKEIITQYRIHDDHIGWGTKKEKYRANINAIMTLKKCEEMGRLATPDEQEILAGYVGWGGLSEVFEGSRNAWQKECAELQSILTEDEYTSARRSTMTAFYTPPIVIRAMYKVLEGMGLKAGNILDPACGTGHFIGAKPDSLSGCKMYGVELDSISGRIAKQLYQKSDISICGFETAVYPDNFFDVVVGNVPFGQITIADKRYDKYKFKIHDYFFVKALDKVRPGGVIAFITSAWTMDKANTSIREYIAERAELLGAIRLPDNTFQKNAGTDVTADILFFQKRDRIVKDTSLWIYLDEDENGISQNRYFVYHPDMVLGKMTMRSTQYGERSTCQPYEGMELEKMLSDAISNIRGELKLSVMEPEKQDNTSDEVIPADPNVKNYSYTLVNDRIYYRENSQMKPVMTNKTADKRIRGMIVIRDCVRELISKENANCSDAEIRDGQDELNRLYDDFTKHYGLLNSNANRVFSDDSSYPLLCALEVIDADGELMRKSDMFTKRTIKPRLKIEKVETSVEALAISLSEKAIVDMSFMCRLTGKSPEEVEKDLRGQIFRLPEDSNVFVPSEEYLSGNVRMKLREAKAAAEENPIYKVNVAALEHVQPEDLTPSEIDVQLGTTWIPASDIQEFMKELFEMSAWEVRDHSVTYSKYTGCWTIEDKRYGYSILTTSTYGTSQKNAYELMEDALNMKDTLIYDIIEVNGCDKRVLNKEATAIVQGKQDLMKQKFKDWIWMDDERRNRLTKMYNERFNSNRSREYNGDHLMLEGINPAIHLRSHQKNGIARIMYGGNTLLAHVVGAGKTYTMVAAAMEMKRLGLCNKSMVVVPNHIIEQFAAEWMTLYPGANILVATKKDFEKQNRKRFCARIATSDIDAVIIGQSQFFKIPVSLDYQKCFIQREIAEIEFGLQETNGRIAIKQMERMKNNLEIKLDKLNDQFMKDDVLCFEELGIDRLFVDEADSYKNLFVYTKMTNVGGISQTEAKKASDLYMKCRYLDELTEGKGVIFATGTPISNSMVEMYTMQRYLQYDVLEENGVSYFDAWASVFGEKVTAIELAPEGTGYRMKTRFAKFHNLPELMTMFRMVADVQTDDMLDLPKPKADYQVIKLHPSDIQKDLVEQLAERADLVRNGLVDAKEDNMLKITNDGRKLALDQRLSDPLFPDDEDSKVNACVDKVFRYWEEGKEARLTQLVFSDLSTPKKDIFNVYDDLKAKLVKKGVPEDEIAFIHSANTDQRKKELFEKVRNGVVRVLIGSTFKMGAGTNVQDRIIASHDLDCPWRPRDLEQRAGRTVRQGNTNETVHIIRYVTEGTFDAYLYQILENKQKFISQIMTSKNPARTVEDIDETALSYAEIKALASGNPRIKEKMMLDTEVSKLQLQKQGFLDQLYHMKDNLNTNYPNRIRLLTNENKRIAFDLQCIKESTVDPTNEVFSGMTINGVKYLDRKEAGMALINAANKSAKVLDALMIGEYRGLPLKVHFDLLNDRFVLDIGYGLHIFIGKNSVGNTVKMDNAITNYPDMISKNKMKIKDLMRQIEIAKVEVTKEFPYQKELEEKSARLAELNSLLEMDKVDRVIADVA